jgi:hypothetical protein
MPSPLVFPAVAFANRQSVTKKNKNMSLDFAIEVYRTRLPIYYCQLPLTYYGLLISYYQLPMTNNKLLIK